MRAADENKLAKLINRANNVRTGLLTDGVDMRSISAVISVDGRVTTLRWSSGETDPQGNVMADDWIVSID